MADKSPLGERTAGHEVTQGVGPARKIDIRIGLVGHGFEDRFIPIYVGIPVGIRSTAEQLQIRIGKFRGQAVVGICLVDQYGGIMRVQELRLADRALQSGFYPEVYLWPAIAATAGGDNEYAVCTFDPINSGGRSVLEDGDIFDFVDVDLLQLIV